MRWKKRLYLLLGSALLVFESSVGLTTGTGVGFCMDQISGALADTGFAAVSTLSQAACIAPYQWCDLVNTTDTWDTEYPTGTAVTITYYYFSTCCSGKQRGKLLNDPDLTVGLPTCSPGKSAASCTRMEWHMKLMADLIHPGTSGYRKTVTPSKLTPDPMRYGGISDANVSCLCGPDDPGCSRWNKDGSVCLICETTASCSPDTVDLNINFFKIHSVDLKTSQLSFAVWLRMEWYDYRLVYDYQCYGGLEYFEVIGEAGTLENSQIWVPDIDLYNHEESIWYDSIAARLATVYSCWDGKPSRGGCGYVFWSRPGMLKALCKYEGLVRFPYDELSCELEIAAWVIDGRFMDIQLRAKDNGVEWMKEGSNAVAGLTAGSKFQDYQIKDIVARRFIVRYASFVSLPWPEMLYKVEFRRSHSYYAIQLILPGVTLSVLSFLAFWMNAAVTDRLGYGITIILAVFTNQVTAAMYMPQCEEKVLMDYINIIFYIFSSLSLLESGAVLYLNQLSCSTWIEAVVPKWVWKIRSLECLKPPRTDTGKSKKFKLKRQGKEQQLRRQMYHQIFLAIDVDFSGSLGIEEIEEFGSFIKGERWSKKESEEFLYDLDHNWDGVLDYEEFAFFCEENLLREYRDEPDTLKLMIKGFLQLMDKKMRSIRLMWKLRASLCDQFCRWAIPPGFFFFLAECILLQEEDYKLMSTNKFLQTIVILSGLFPIWLIFLGKGVLILVEAYRNGTLCATKINKEMQLFKMKETKEVSNESEEAWIPQVQNEWPPEEQSNLRGPARNPSNNGSRQPPVDPSPRTVTSSPRSRLSPRSQLEADRDYSVEPQTPPRPKSKAKGKAKMKLKRKSSEDRAAARQGAAKPLAKPLTRPPLPSYSVPPPSSYGSSAPAPGARQYAAF